MVDLAGQVATVLRSAEIGRGSVRVGDVEVPVAWHLKAESRIACFFYNGAINRSLAPDGVAFQRSSWSEEILANCVFVSDPALIRRERGVLGWGQISEDSFAGDVFSRLAKAVGEVLSISAERRIHFGSSAGGYQALVTAAADPGSRALVNNPQTDWLRYEIESEVDGVLRDCFSGMRCEELIARMPWRVRVWEWFLRCGNVPYFDYYVNTASREDMQNQLQPMLRALLCDHERFNGATWSVHYYRDERAGHSPQAKAAALRALNSVLHSM